MLITKNITLDLSVRGFPEIIDAVQNDNHTRAVKISLTDNGTPWEPPDNARASVAFRKPDMTSGWYDTLPTGDIACEIEGSTVTTHFAPEMLTSPGKVRTVVIFMDESLNQLATFPFVVNVEENPAAGKVISNSYYNVKTLADVNAAIDEVNGIVNQFLIANGAYYKPTVDEEGNLSWKPSIDKMPAIPGVNIRGPKGDSYNLTAEDKSEIARDIVAEFEGEVDESVRKWLDEHPEATTSVQDGSISEEKLSTDLQETLQSLSSVYTTPEQFGAVGDGKTDDYEALQKAINDAQANSGILLLSKKYLTSQQLVVSSAIRITSISGKRGTLIANSAIDSIILIDNTTDSGFNISIDGVKFDCKGKCDAIKLGSCYLIYFVLHNLEFYNAISCVNIYNDKNTAVQCFYSHNISWTRWRTQNCTNVIRQEFVNGASSPWVYGGIIDDIAYDGWHTVPGGDYVFDFRGFRNVNVSNVIAEGGLQGISLDAVFYIEYEMNIDTVYFEIVNSSTLLNYFVLLSSETGAGICASVTNVYGCVTRPIKVTKERDMLTVSYLSQSIPDKIVAEDNLGYIVFDKFTTCPNNIAEPKYNTISSKCRYNLLKKTGVLLHFNDSLPVLTVDADKIAENPQCYGSLLQFSNYNGRWVLGTETDPLFGTCLTAQDETYNAAGNSIVANFSGKLTRMTMAVTFKCNNVDDLIKLIPNNTSRYFTFFDSSEKVEDKFVTVLATSDSGIIRFRFDDYNAEFDSTYKKQSYTIADISIFAGYNYGQCKSKWNTDIV